MKSRLRGYTLFEVILVLGILVAVFTMLWGLVETYSLHYSSGIRSAESAQLVRSLTQLLADDLNAAIQDPVQDAARILTSTGDDSIRRFGLRGTSSTLRIDVVQVNPFRSTAIPTDSSSSSPTGTADLEWGMESSMGNGIGTGGEFSQRTAAGGFVTMSDPQVPELKTVYYDFFSGQPVVTAQGISAAVASHEKGLFRRELDFESPVESLAKVDGQSSDEMSPDGMLSDEMFSDGMSFYGMSPSTAELPAVMAGNSTPLDHANRLSAPEVVFCQFRYYDDSSQWRDTWDSIEQKGLPVAISVLLQIVPLSEAATLHSRAMVGELPSQTAARLGLPVPMESRIIVHLPTSPLNRHQTYRRPAAPVVASKNRVTTPSNPPTKTKLLQEGATSPATATKPVSPSSPKPPTPRAEDWIRQ